jgi:hypothetical protein
MLPPIGLEKLAFTEEQVQIMQQGPEPRCSNVENCKGNRAADVGSARRKQRWLSPKKAIVDADVAAAGRLRMQRRTIKMECEEALSVAMPILEAVRLTTELRRAGARSAGLTATGWLLVLEDAAENHPWCTYGHPCCQFRLLTGDALAVLVLMLAVLVLQLMLTVLSVVLRHAFVQVTLVIPDAAISDVSRYIRELSTTMHGGPIRIDLAVSDFTLYQMRTEPHFDPMYRGHLCMRV